MEWFSSILPVTVVAAVVLFVMKEILEAVRRRHADRRKLKAVRTLLARECELNLWTHKRIKSELKSLEEHFREDLPFEYAIRRRQAGDPMFEIRYLDGDIHHAGSLPDAYTDVMNKVMLDVAATDSKLFRLLEEAYDAAVNLRHLRNSLINHVEGDDEDFERTFFKSFPAYGLSELTDILVDLEHLYRACTGEELTEHRVR